MRAIFLMICSLLLCACGGGGGGESSPNEAKPVDHPGLTVSAVSAIYGDNLRLPLQVDGVVGTQSISFAPGAPIDVVALTTTVSNDLQVLHAGDTELLIEDSGNSHYLGTSVRVPVHIAPAPRAPLLLDDISLELGGEDWQLAPTNALGQLSYRLSEPGVISVSKQGVISTLSTGEVTLSVEDDGGRDHLASTASVRVVVTAARVQVAEFESLTPKPFVEGARLQPVYSGSLAPQRQFTIAQDEDTQVVWVDADSGEMQILHAGQTRVQVTQSSELGEVLSVQRFQVTVEPVANTALRAEAQELEYGFDTQFSLPVEGSIGALEFALADEESEAVVVPVDGDSGRFEFVGIGEARVRVTDAGDRDHKATETITTVKVRRIAANSLITRDLELTYSAGLQTLLPVVGQQGTLSFKLADDAATGVVQLAEDGNIELLKPGQTEIRVEDDGGDFYEPQSGVVRVTVGKMTNPDLVADNLKAVFSEQGTLVPQVRGAKGMLSFQVRDQEESVKVLAQGSDGGIQYKGAGRGWVTVTDAGNDYYLPAETYFYVDVSYAEGTLEVDDIDVQFAEGKQVALAISGQFGSLSFRPDNGQPEDVVRFDADTGMVTLLNAGSTYYSVTDSGDAGHGAKSVMVRVTVRKAEANPNLALDRSLIEDKYVKDAPLYAPKVSGKLEDSTLKYAAKVYGQQVVSLDDSNGSMLIQNAGTALMTVTESSRNYEDRVLEFEVRVTPSPYPGVPALEVVNSVAFYPGMTIDPPEVINPLGKVSYSLYGAYPADQYGLSDDGILTVHAFPSKPPIVLHVTDDGGNNYQAGQNSSSRYFSGFAEDAGEQARLTFDGSELQIDSPVTIPTREVSFFKAFTTSEHAQTVGEEDKDGSFSLQKVTVCGEKGCFPIMLRLQLTGSCKDGSQLANALGSLQTPDCASLVSLSFDEGDQIIPSIPTGQFRSREPLMLVHYARPYTPGEVVEAGDLQARAWWLVDVDIKLP
ncbi:hypothetical protein [Ferrimonas sp. YFM]|uniref:hypothetical protein n=1 Tax=Ferrimonas sp. YFM TaxID=3028878 RepID=UPI002573E94D|nr:hypothetical protein [Ferrimonas sp. YFM]BDY06151.1 hypothetical protein F0521_31920 [Ferrimonas sp. YFM]